MSPKIETIVKVYVGVGGALAFLLMLLAFASLYFHN